MLVVVLIRLDGEVLIFAATVHPGKRLCTGYLLFHHARGSIMQNGDALYLPHTNMPIYGEGHRRNQHHEGEQG